MTFLFDSTIFGPIKSRRLGTSLGINLLPTAAKFCNFNCVYCECGLTTPLRGAPKLPTRAEVAAQLEATLQRMQAQNERLDSITFAGNGEPTIHPEFAEIVDDVLALRNRYAPSCVVSVLSNATRLADPKVFAALHKVDNRILKLDAGTEDMYRRINQSLESDLTLTKLVELLKTFEGNFTLQTLFFHGTVDNVSVDNTVESEVAAWLECVKTLRPQAVMLYSLARDTPYNTLQPATREELEAIAKKVEALGIRAEIF